MFFQKCLLSWVAALAIPVLIYSAPASAQAPGPEVTIDGQQVPVETYQIAEVKGTIQGGPIYADQLTLTVPPLSPQAEDTLESGVGKALSELELTTYSYSSNYDFLYKTVQTFKRSSEQGASFRNGNGILIFWFEEVSSTTFTFKCDGRWNGTCTSSGS